MSKIQALVLDGYGIDATDCHGATLVAAIARQRALEDAASDAARVRYERHLFNEARAIADGRVTTAPTAEHVRVLLGKLDGLRKHHSDRAAF